MTVTTFRRLMAVAVVLAAMATGGVATAQQRVLMIDDPAITDMPQKDDRSFRVPRWPSGEGAKSGATTFVACVDETGRLHNPLLVDSSGRPALDEEVLRWATELHWLPAKRGDAPVAVCGWPITWVWQRPGAKPPKLPYSDAVSMKLDATPALVPGAPPPVRPEGETPPGYADSGKQELEVCVGPTGKVEHVTITIGLYNPAMNDAIRAWARGLAFTPAVRRGNPVGVCGVRFTYTWPKQLMS